MYFKFNDSFENSIKIYKNQINESLLHEKIKHNVSAIEYNRLTQEYFKYLNEVYNNLKGELVLYSIKDKKDHFWKNKYSNQFFFNDNGYTSRADKFITETNTYRQQILKLIKDENLKNRIKNTLYTIDIKNRKGENIKLLNYLYENSSLISVLSNLNYRKNAILEVENTYLKNIIISE